MRIFDQTHYSVSRYATSVIKMSLDVNISEPDEFNCIQLHNCMESVAKINNINDFTYHVDILCGKGENYIANIFRVLIKDSESDKRVSVIVKTLINTIRQELFQELHNREVNAYKYIIEKYLAIQDSAKSDDRIILPKCVLASTTKNNEIIVLEDLLLSGFVIDNKLVKYEKLNYAQVRLILTELGKFHALTFVYEKMDEYFSTVQNIFTDLIFQDIFLNKAKLRDYFYDSFETSVSFITDDEIKSQLKFVKHKLISLLKMYTEPKKYNVFCHGDCWINNILFKDEGNKKSLCFLDFQAIRYASPVTDILYFLYICTDSEFRSEYFEKLKKEYYNSFELFLKQYDIEANTVYPEEEFENEIREMLPFGLLIALVELRIVTTPEDNTITDDSTMEERTEIIEENLLATRINDVVNESVNNGVFKNLLDLVRSFNKNN